jgi:hypothetical protein
MNRNRLIRLPSRRDIGTGPIISLDGQIIPEATDRAVAEFFAAVRELPRNSQEAKYDQSR